MAKKKLHPSVQQFKEYVRAHPELIQQVRSGRKSWQELYEEWFLFHDPKSRDSGDKTEHVGEAKSTNSSPKDEAPKKDFMSTVLGAVKSMDPIQMQQHIASISTALGAIQGVISSLQGGGSEPAPPKKNVGPPPHPFQFRQD